MPNDRPWVSSGFDENFSMETSRFAKDQIKLKVDKLQKARESEREREKITYRLIQKIKIARPVFARYLMLSIRSL